MKKRIFAITLAIMMLMSVLPARMASAGTAAEPVPPKAASVQTADSDYFTINILPDKTLQPDVSDSQPLGKLEAGEIDESSVAQLFTYIMYTDLINSDDPSDKISLRIFEKDLGEIKPDTGRSVEKNYVPNLYHNGMASDSRYTNGRRAYEFSAIVGDCSKAAPGATYTAQISYDAAYLLTNEATVRGLYSKKTTLTVKIPAFNYADYFKPAIPGEAKLFSGVTDKTDIGQISVKDVDKTHVKDITVSVKYGQLVNVFDSSDKIVFSVYTSELGEMPTNGSKPVKLYSDGTFTPQTISVVVPDWSSAAEGAEYKGHITYSFTMTAKNGRTYTGAVSAMTDIIVDTSDKPDETELMLVPTDRMISAFDTKRTQFGETRYIGGVTDVKKVTLFVSYSDLVNTEDPEKSIPIDLYSSISGKLDKTGDATGMTVLEDGVYTPHNLLLETPEWNDPVPGAAYETEITYRYTVEDTEGAVKEYSVKNKTVLRVEIPEEEKNRTIIYDANGGTGAPDEQTAAEGEDLIISDKTPIKSYKVSFVVSGDDAPADRTLDCAFAEWNTDPDGKSNSFKPGDKYDMEGNVVLYAQYTDPKAGALPEASKDGYDFEGWYTADEGGEKVTADTVINADTTVYARFSKTKPTSPTDVTPTEQPTKPTEEPTKPTEQPTDEGIKRLGGVDRYGTAELISAEGWNKAGIVVIAAGGNYPDALAGAVLAKRLGSPILLTAKDKLSDSTLSEIQRIEAKKAYILGGEAAVSKNVDKQLSDKGIQTVRLAGSNRNDTAAKIAYRTVFGTESMPFSDSTAALAGYTARDVNDAADTDTAVLVSGQSYPDALSASAAAAINGWPILFLNPDGSVPTETKTAIANLGVSKVYIIGGNAAVGSKADTTLRGLKLSVTRVYGDDRYATSIKIYDTFKDSFTSKNAAVATGKNFPDALSGAAFAANRGMNVFLVGDSASDALKTRAGKAGTLYVFGGTSAVPDSVVKALTE